MKTFVLSLLLFTGIFEASPARADLAPRAYRSKVGDIDVIVYPTHVKNVITLGGFLPAGDALAQPGKLAVPSLTGMLLERGTLKQDQFAIAQKLENAGARIEFAVDNQLLNIHGRLRKQSLSLVVGTLAEELRIPALSAQELDKARQQFIGDLRTKAQDIGFRADEAFDLAVYPVGHPNRPVPYQELIKAAEHATLDDLKAFHKQHYGPTNLTLIFVGDADPAAINREVAKAFAGWRGGARILESPVAPPTAPQEVVVALREKPSAMVILGQATSLRYKDNGALALRVGTAILGSGFTGRLMKSVRDKEGLTYSINAGMSDDTLNDGSWAINASFAPELLQRGLTSMRRELQSWWSGGVTPAELSARKQNMIGSYEVNFESTSGTARVIQLAVERGFDLTWLDEYPKAVNALTVEQVNGAIKKYIAPGKMVLVKAGSI